MRRSSFSLITLALAWYFHDSVKWYEYDVERIALANRIREEVERRRVEESPEDLEARLEAAIALDRMRAGA